MFAIAARNGSPRGQRVGVASRISWSVLYLPRWAPARPGSPAGLAPRDYVPVSRNRGPARSPAEHDRLSAQTTDQAFRQTAFSTSCAPATAASLVRRTSDEADASDGGGRGG